MCGKSIGNGVTFLYISTQPPLRSWTWLYRQKANKTTSSVWQYSQLFMHESNTICHSAHSNQWDWVRIDTHTHTHTKWKQHNLCQFHSVHLADIITLNSWSTVIHPISKFWVSLSISRWDTTMFRVVLHYHRLSHSFRQNAQLPVFVICSSLIYNCIMLIVFLRSWLGVRQCHWTVKISVDSSKLKL